MPFYEVTWVIETDADTHEDAALFARGAQLDPANIATYYYVRELSDDRGQAVEDEGRMVNTDEIVSFKICDFCEEQADTLTPAEMRWAGGTQRGKACEGCLEDPDAFIYEFPNGAN